jgi:hypothetical protein
MPDKAIISDYTHRPLDKQRANAGDMPVFVLPTDLPQLFRPTTRKLSDHYHVDSLAIIAKKEDEFRNFLANARSRNAKIVSRDEKQTFVVNANCEYLVKRWKTARRAGAGKVGADQAARLRRDESKKGCDAIKAEWPLTQKEMPTAELLKKANAAIGKRGKMHYRTAVSFLGSRPIAQYQRKAAQKRKESRNAKAN